MKGLRCCQFGIVLPRTGIAILEMFFFDDFDFEWHFGLINNLVHMGSESLKGKGSRVRRDAFFWLCWLVLARPRILIFLSFESLDGISRPVDHMHALMMQCLGCILYVIAARPVLFPYDRAFDYHRLVHFGVVRVGQDDSNELLVSPNRVGLSLIIGVLDGLHLGLRLSDRLVICRLETLRFVFPGLAFLAEAHLNIDALLLIGWVILCFKSFHLGVEAAGHLQPLLRVYLFCMFWVIRAWPSIGCEDIKLCDLKGRAIKRSRMLIYLPNCLFVLSRPRDCFVGLEDALFLRFSEDKCHCHSIYQQLIISATAG